MLGRSERESGTHAKLAARAAGWNAQDQDPFDELLDLGTMTATLSTVANIHGLSAVLYIGHPAQPSYHLERSLLGADPALMITSTVAVPPQWVWVGRTAEATGRVIIDDAGVRDCQQTLRTMGLNPQLVDTGTSLEKRIDLAGPNGTLVIERSRVPAGFAELPGSTLLMESAPIWFGLVEARRRPVKFDEASQVWLAFGPRSDYRGSLQQTLALIAGIGIDLQHLRSNGSVAGPHVFFSSFACSDSSVLDQLVGEFEERKVSHRVLAVMSGDGFVPGPDAVAPSWTPRTEDAPA